MKKSTEQRVERIKERMRSAMPEIKRQVDVYEKSLKSGKLNATPKIAPQFRRAWTYAIYHRGMQWLR